MSRGGGADVEGEYIVPTKPEFVAYSRFKVQIVEGYKGPDTQRISYIFPEFLVGSANKVISFEKVQGSENSWISPELTAHCATLGEEFTCNIYVNKSQTSILNKNSCSGTSLAKNNTINPRIEFGADVSIRHLDSMNLGQDELIGYTGVIQSFFCNEPAGFLTYDFE